MKAAGKITLIFFIFQLIGCVNIQTKAGTLAEKRYSDPNYFFKIVPPDGWQIQQYPEDPRGKVAFIGPDGVELRVLAKGLNYNGYEDMLRELKEIEINTGINNNIDEITFIGIPAVRRTFILEGIKMLFIDFMIGNTSHNLMYSASTDKFEEYYSLAQESMATYEPTLSGVSPEDVTEHIIARSLRLSQIFYEQGNNDLALELINEGLEAEPNNTKLLEMKNKVLVPKNVEKNEEDTNKNESEEKDNSDKKGPGLYIILSLIGAALITFSKSIANATSWPGFARLTVPIIGVMIIYFGLFEGVLFDKGYIFLGTIIVMLIIFASPIIYQLVTKDRKSVTVRNANSRKCSICGCKLITKAPSGTQIGTPDQIRKWFNINKTAFACENCGVKVCRGCATLSECPKCGGVRWVNMTGQM